MPLHLDMAAYILLVEAQLKTHRDEGNQEDG